MSGVPQKSLEQKRLEGTWRHDRDAAREEAESALKGSAAIFPQGAKVSCPRTIRTRYARAYWKTLVSMLLSLGQLSPADLPEVEALCILLEKMREAEAAFLEAEPLSKEYDVLLNAFLKLSRRFSDLSSKYYVSPQARSRLALDAFNAARAGREAEAAGGAVAAVLAGRKGT